MDALRSLQPRKGLLGIEIDIPPHLQLLDKFFPAENRVGLLLLRGFLAQTLEWADLLVDKSGCVGELNLGGIVLPVSDVGTAINLSKPLLENLSLLDHSRGGFFDDAEEVWHVVWAGDNARRHLFGQLFMPERMEKEISDVGAIVRQIDDLESGFPSDLNPEH